jgi:hypothetical protein
MRELDAKLSEPWRQIGRHGILFGAGLDNFRGRALLRCLGSLKPLVYAVLRYWCY